MYAQCPECLTIYKLRTETLAQGRGRLRCGTCAVEFDALLTLVDELPSDLIGTLKRHAPARVPPEVTVPAARPPSKQHELFQVPEPKPTAAPAFVRSVPARRRTPARWLWLNAALGALALAQLTWLYRELLLQQPGTRPLIEGICRHLVACQAQRADDRRRIALLSRDIRPHPSVPHALIISATLANQGLFTQSYPVIEITLSDVNEHRIAMRRFLPTEYVTDTRVLRKGIPAGGMSSFHLEVEDPSQDAVAFEFRFL